MPSKILRNQIDANGHAHAIIYLHPKIMKFREGVNQVERGRILRHAPHIEEAILRDLGAKFNSGWQMFQESLNSEINEAERTSNTSHHALSELRLHRKRPPMLHFPHLGVMYGALDYDGLQSLEDHDAVLDVVHAPELTLNKPTGPSKPVEDGDTTNSWGVERMQGPELWNDGYTGTDVLIAHLDTGADSRHPALDGAIIENMMFDSDGNESGAENPCVDSAGHGTHTAATAAGRNPPGAPVVGMAPHATLASGTVLTGGGVLRILGGMDWALKIGARVLSMSIGYRGWDDSYTQIVTNMRNANLLPVVAIGNFGEGSSTSPGNYANVLSVGFCGRDNKVDTASSSEHGDNATGPVLCGPGVDIKSALVGGGYVKESGSSMATPHIAGLAAILMQAKPNACIDEIQQVIVSSCKNPAGEPKSRIGAGIPESMEALERLLST